MFRTLRLRECTGNSNLLVAFRRSVMNDYECLLTGNTLVNRRKTLQEYIVWYVRKFKRSIVDDNFVPDHVDRYLREAPVSSSYRTIFLQLVAGETLIDAPRSAGTHVCMAPRSFTFFLAA